MLIYQRVSSENLIPVSQLEPLSIGSGHQALVEMKHNGATLPARCGENEIKTLKIICVRTKKGKTTTGWWFGTCFIFHNIWDNPSQLTNSVIFQRGIPPTRTTTTTKKIKRSLLAAILGWISTDGPHRGLWPNERTQISRLLPS